MDFLLYLHKTYKLSYTSLNTARSALSCILVLDTGTPFGQHPAVKRLMTGFFNMHPPKPRYAHTWDVKIVLNLLKSWNPVSKIDLKTLTLKLSMLLALVSGQRVQTLCMLDLRHCSQSTDEYIFTFQEPLKHSRVGKSSQIVRLKAYTPNKGLCVYRTLVEYVKRTKKLRKDHRLLISYVKPHGHVSRDTVARWLRTVMSKAGINVDIFKAHSCRSAVHSKAKASFVPIDTILSTGGWASADTFSKFYDRAVVSFETGILNT